MNNTTIKYLIGVDGGGSGTRIVVTDLQKNILAKGKGLPSALSLGRDRAWRSIIDTLLMTFSSENIPIPMLHECAIGLGLSGVNNSNWKAEFQLLNPGFKIIEIDTDGYTTLLGAHEGKAGSIVALGTGSIGMILKKNGLRTSVSGWGFPSGDEASGSWLGLKAINIAEQVLDQRLKSSPLSNRILSICGSDEQKLLSWLSFANQNTLATLAPLVFEAAKIDNDQLAIDLLNLASHEVEKMALALDPALSYQFSICGSLGEALIPYLSSKIKSINQAPKSDSSFGALYLLGKYFP
jgi:glucosamine kinase